MKYLLILPLLVLLIYLFFVARRWNKERQCAKLTVFNTLLLNMHRTPFEHEVFNVRVEEQQGTTYKIVSEEEFKTKDYAQYMEEGKYHYSVYISYPFNIKTTYRITVEGKSYVLSDITTHVTRYYGDGLMLIPELRCGIQTYRLNGVLKEGYLSTIDLD